jgi:endonuclease V-like protein UPF0215 family
MTRGTRGELSGRAPGPGNPRVTPNPAKPHPRVYAFDDAPFSFADRTVPVVGLVVSLPGYVEAVLKTRVEVDGSDSTEVLARVVQGSPHREASQAILLGGISLGGFNIVDLSRLHEATGLPVITVTRRPPDFGAMERALQRHAPGRPELLTLLRRHPLHPFPVRPEPLWFAAVGLGVMEAKGLLRKSLVRGSFPEPLRLAHLFASVIPPGPPSRSRA